MHWEYFTNTRPRSISNLIIHTHTHHRESESESLEMMGRRRREKKGEGERGVQKREGERGVQKGEREYLYSAVKMKYSPPPSRKRNKINLEKH